MSPPNTHQGGKGAASPYFFSTSSKSPKTKKDVEKEVSKGATFATLTPVVLTDYQLEQLADLIAERLQEQNEPVRTAVRFAPDRSLVDAATLAGLLGVSRSTVYEHAAELGAVEVGGGERPRLRFDPQTALEAWSRRSRSGGSHVPQSPVVAGVRRVRRPDRLGTSGGLLPIRGMEAR